MSGRLWVGSIFIVFGIGLLLHQADVWDFSNVLSSWWPLVLIIIGVIQLINRTVASSVSGLLFIVVGGLFLLNQWIDVNLIAYIWPLILIFIGFAFIFMRVKREKPFHSERAINTFTLFSGVDVRPQSKSFEGGAVTAVFGGAEIDLRDVTISDKGAVLDLSAVFGGIDITVPRDVHVEVTGIPVFGGWENKTRRHVNGTEVLPVLKVNCLAVFGGVEIKD